MYTLYILGPFNENQFNPLAKKFTLKNMMTFKK